MASTIYFTRWKNVETILQGNFDSSHSEEFRAFYDGVSVSNHSQYTVNFEKVDYIDSSALGMLLILQEYANDRNVRMVLSNCSKIILDIFSTTSFDKISRLSKANKH